MRATDEALKSTFRASMRRLASAVAVVTVQGDDDFVGMAATSVTSLTLDPPAVLVCVNRTAGLHSCLAVGTPICINLLSSHQSDVSTAFGGGLPRAERFSVGRWGRDAHGLPALDEAQANLSCVVESIVAYGTHSIVVARVAEVRLGGPVSPLIYQDGAYL
jgi:flavin reductase (DIM6/NTAB) family NADH-FMN oxidoreductase RutF